MGFLRVGFLHAAGALVLEDRSCRVGLLVLQPASLQA